MYSMYGTPGSIGLSLASSYLPAMVATNTLTQPFLSLLWHAMELWSGRTGSAASAAVTLGCRSKNKLPRY